jgi:CHAD domain-containing protein
LREDLDALDFAEVEKTHDVRKQAKRVRYSAERFRDILGDDATGVAKDMTAHQDNLGAICDARVNIDIINGFQLDELPEPVAWDLALLRAENETFLYSTLRESR